MAALTVWRPAWAQAALVRLLDELAPVQGAATPPGLAHGLADWLDWTSAIALSAALDSPAPPAGEAFAVPLADEAERLRGLQGGAIDADPDLATVPAELPVEFAIYRQAYLARQQAMERAIGVAREGLRQVLVARSPELARLAAVDAVLEQALAPRLQTLLATGPARLRGHFERLRRAAGADAAPAAWMPGFLRDARALLRAELDVRLLPLEGLMKALTP